MENFSTYLIAFNIIGSLVLLFAALEREISMWLAFIVSLIFTPIIGYLFLLCFPTKVEVDSKILLKRIMDKLCEEEK